MFKEPLKSVKIFTHILAQKPYKNVIYGWVFFFQFFFLQQLQLTLLALKPEAHLMFSHHSYVSNMKDS